LAQFALRSPPTAESFTRRRTVGHSTNERRNVERSNHTLIRLAANCGGNAARRPRWLGIFLRVRGRSAIAGADQADPLRRGCGGVAAPATKASAAPTLTDSAAMPLLGAAAGGPAALHALTFAITASTVIGGPARAGPNGNAVRFALSGGPMPRLPPQL
jgi:hypothetical protein